VKRNSLLLSAEASSHKSKKLRQIGFSPLQRRKGELQCMIYVMSCQSTSTL